MSQTKKGVSLRFCNGDLKGNPDYNKGIFNECVSMHYDPVRVMAGSQTKRPSKNQRFSVCVCVFLFIQSAFCFCRGSV